MYKLTFFISFLLFTFTGRAQNGWKTLKPIPAGAAISELSVYHCECTGSRSLDIDTGFLIMPEGDEQKVAHTIDISQEQETELFGKKQKRLTYIFQVRGIVTKVLDRGGPQKAGPRYVPFFDIYQYRVLRKALVFDPSLVNWKNVDSLFQPLPSSVHVFMGDKQSLTNDTGGFRAYYVIADLNDKRLTFTTDTSKNRRLTPAAFYEKNDKPLLVVNTTFFSFATNQNLNVVIKEGKLVSYNVHTIPGRGKDTLTYRHPFGSAIGISKKRTADIAWLHADTAFRYAFAYQEAVAAERDSLKSIYQNNPLKPMLRNMASLRNVESKRWKMQTAVGGGPVLVQDGQIMITNNEELKFTGKAIDDKHPRTAMGYTEDGKLIILVIEGRNKNAAGASLTLEAEILRDLGCVEALNLDGGGSSCMLVNGKETIKPSDKEGQRPVPAVFIIQNR
ncbi:MAG: phosphodiester glycosidase family protein [Chitinophagaceae bacterium]|nr:phosphodiester glycosidase family protein [Chitinophagaceae bacterium]